MAGRLFLIFAEKFLRFTPFLQNYQVFKLKSANLCNKKCQKLFIAQMSPLPNPTHPLPSGWENPEDSPSPRSQLRKLFLH